MSRKQVYNTEEAVSYGGTSFRRWLFYRSRKPRWWWTWPCDLVPNHYDLVEENPTLSPPLPISVQNTDTSDDNTNDLSDDVDSTGVSVALPELHITAYDWKTEEKLKLIMRFHSFYFMKGQ